MVRINKTKVNNAMFEANIATQGELAKAAGLSANTVSYLMRGLPGKIETIRKICDAVGCKPLDILQDD